MHEVAREPDEVEGFGIDIWRDVILFSPITHLNWFLGLLCVVGGVYSRVSLERAFRLAHIKHLGLLSESMLELISELEAKTNIHSKLSLD